MQEMRFADLDATLEYLDLSNEQAAVAFGVSEAEIHLMRHGALPIPFFISAIAALMSESEASIQIALEHGYAMRDDDRYPAQLLPRTKNATRALKPALRVVRGES